MVFRRAFLLPTPDQQMALYDKAKILLWHPVLNVPLKRLFLFIEIGSTDMCKM